MNTEDDWLICERWNPLDVTMIRTKSKPASCELCGTRVGVSASGRVAIEDKGLRVSCFACARQHVNDGVEVMHHPAISAQVKDLSGVDPAVATAGMSASELLRRFGFAEAMRILSRRPQG